MTPTSLSAKYERRTVGRRLAMAPREVVHRGLVRELDDRSFSAGVEHPLDLLGARARDHAEVGMLLLDAANVIGVGSARGMPHVPELERAPDRAIGAAADPDLRQRRRVRLRHRLVERPELALVVALAVPAGAHQADRLGGAAAAALARDAHEVVLVLVPPHADPEVEASAGKLLHGRDLLGQVHRVVQGNEDDRRAEAYPLRPAGDPA